MPAKVILLAVQGPIKGTKYRFDDQLLCMTGRAETCMLQLTGEAAAGVSRQHCMFDVKPPHVTLFDLESRNGTYVNGQRITGEDHPEKIKSRELKSGDLIRIGGNVFEIKLIPAAKCCICGNELSCAGAAPAFCRISTVGKNSQIQGLSPVRHPDRFTNGQWENGLHLRRM